MDELDFSIPSLDALDLLETLGRTRPPGVVLSVATMDPAVSWGDVCLIS